MLEALSDLAASLITPRNALQIGKDSHSRAQLAAMLSGSSDRKSKPYKAALRNVERYYAPAGKQQRKASPATLEKLAGALKQDEKAQQAALASGPDDVYRVNYDGDLCISEDCRFRHISYSVQKKELFAAALGQGEQDQRLALIYPYVEADKAPGVFSIRRA